MDQVKKVFLIQVFNSFAGGILGVVLPLMIEARNIDIVTIGFVFASMPIIFQILRMFFATVSDFWGRKIFFVFNGLARGFHVGETLSLALAGILISISGFTVPFLMSALIYIPFYVTSYLMLKSAP